MPFKPDSTAGGATTRATKLTSVSSFKLYAYNASGTAIANGVTYTKSGNSWTTTSNVFWPQTGNVTFYAFSPASNSSVSFNTTSKTLTYTALTAQGSQQDVLYAYKTSSRPTNNTVDLTFDHANAAFSVNARLATGCTATVNVSGVQLVNVKPTNTLTFSDGSTSVSGDNIASTLACSAKTLTTSNQAISTEPLIIPSQAITAWAGNNAISSQTGAYLAVTCKVQSNGTYVVGSASANGTVYVPMDKTLNKGEDNSVNLVFGTLDNDRRYYGRNSNGTRIYALEKVTINCTSADLGRIVCTDGSIYNTVSLATQAGKTAAGMIAYIDGTGKHGLILSLKNVGTIGVNWQDAVNLMDSYTPTIQGYTWKMPSRDEWCQMFGAFGGERTDKRTGWSTNQVLYTSGTIRTTMKNCGGEELSVPIYWSSTEVSSTNVWCYCFPGPGWEIDPKTAVNTNFIGRACIVF